MSWQVISQAKKRVWFEERLVPLSVVVDNRKETLKSIREGTKPEVIELTFAIRHPELDPDIVCTIGAWPYITCARISWAGDITDDSLSRLNLEEIGREAYAEWLNTPVYGEGVRVETIVASQRDWTQVAAALGANAELAEVAWIYLQAPTRGTQNVMDAMGYGSRGTASLRVREARKQSLIPPPGAPQSEYQAAFERLKKEREDNGAQS